jgi:Ca-activated chloride channel family protein
VASVPYQPQEKYPVAENFAYHRPVSLSVSMLVALVSMLMAGSVARAGGIFHVFPPSVQDTRYPVARPTVSLSRSMVTVSESDMEYCIEQTFFNDNDLPLKGLYILPLDGQEHTDKATVKIDGAPVPATIMSGESFFHTLKELTQSMQDPSLLGLAGKTVLVAQPVTIGIRDHRTFRVQYTKPLALRDRHLEVSLPLDGERYALAPVAKQEIKVRFRMSRPVRSIFSPSHHLTVQREAPHRCLVSVESESERVPQDFHLLATFSGTELSLSTFFYKSRGKPGNFMALIEPPSKPTEARALTKDVVMLLDCSGSMDARSFESAKSAVLAALARLGAGDRFDVVTIGTQPLAMANRLLAANRENIAAAVRFVSSRENEGGTDLYDSLRTTLELLSSRERHSIVLLASDGNSTVGITSPESIIHDVMQHNRARARIFVLAVGKQADISTLDRLAIATGGSCLHLPETEGVKEAVSHFLSKVSLPRVTNISLECAHFPAAEIGPNPIPDLFGQESLVVLGRYVVDSDTTAEVKLKGRVNGRPYVVTKRVTLPFVDESHPYIARLWAMRRIAQLYDQARLKEALPGLTSRMRSLADKLGFVAPPSTLLTAASYGSAVAGQDPGRLLWNYKTSCVPSDVLSDQFRIVGGKLFRSQQSGWIDTEYLPSLATKNVRFLSEEYFSLLKQNPTIGPYLALGPNVIFVIHGTAYRIGMQP